MSPPSSSHTRVHRNTSQRTLPSSGSPVMEHTTAERDTIVAQRSDLVVHDVVTGCANCRSGTLNPGQGDMNVGRREVTDRRKNRPTRVSTSVHNCTAADPRVATMLANVRSSPPQRRAGSAMRVKAAQIQFESARTIPLASVRVGHPRLRGGAGPPQAPRFRSAPRE